MFIQSPQAFAEYVRSQRIRSGITQEELGARAGMSRRWVQDLESGKLVPSLAAALSVASAFGYELHLEPTQNDSPLEALFAGLK